MIATGIVMAVLGIIFESLFDRAYLKYDGVISNISSFMSMIFGIAAVLGFILIFCGVVVFVWRVAP